MNFVISPEQTSQSGANPVILLPKPRRPGQARSLRGRASPSGQRAPPVPSPGLLGLGGWRPSSASPKNERRREGGRSCFPAGRGRSGDARVALRGISWAAGLLDCCYYYNCCCCRCYNYSCYYYRCYYYYYCRYCYYRYCCYRSFLCIYMPFSSRRVRKAHFYQPSALRLLQIPGDGVQLP